MLRLTVRLNSSLSVETAVVLRVQAWYAAAPSSGAIARRFGEERAGVLVGRSAPVVGDAPSLDQTIQLSSCDGAGGERPLPAVADRTAEVRGLVGSTRRRGRRARENETWVRLRCPSRPSYWNVARSPPAAIGMQRAAVARVAADLEDVGRVVGQLERHVDRLVVLGEVHDRHALAQRVAGHEALPGDPELLAGQALAGADLVVGVAVERRVRQLDDAPEVRPGRSLQDDGPRAADAEHGAREQARVVPVEAQPARVGVDVAELVGQQEHVPVLEDLDAARGRSPSRSVSRRGSKKRTPSPRPSSPPASRRAARFTGASRPLLGLTRHRRLR